MVSFFGLEGLGLRVLGLGALMSSGPEGISLGTWIWA